MPDEINSPSSDNNQEDPEEQGIGIVLFASIPFLIFAIILYLIRTAEDDPPTDFIGENMCLITLVVGSLFLPLMMIQNRRNAYSKDNPWFVIVFLFLIPWMLGIGSILTAMDYDKKIGVVVGVVFAAFFFSFPFFVIYLIKRDT